MNYAKHIKYLKYILKHKWFVMVECFKCGIFYRGITHDLSKFLPSEWIPYVNYFYGYSDPASPIKRKEDFPDFGFNMSWLKHQKRNNHHWQWWILLEDGGDIKMMPMPINSILEMLCDWYGASMAQGFGGWPVVLEWYEKNRDYIKLEENTRFIVETILKRKATNPINN